MTTRLSAEVFKNYLTALQEHFRCQGSEITLQIVRASYWDFLKVCSDEEFKIGVKSALARCKFFPAAQELKELCFDGKTDEQRAFERNSVSVAGLLTPGDDKADCQINLDNFKLIGFAQKLGIDDEAIRDCLFNKRSLRELIMLQKPHLDPSDYGSVLPELGERKIPTTEDFRKIAEATLKLWVEGEDFPSALIRQNLDNK